MQSSELHRYIGKNRPEKHLCVKAKCSASALLIKYSKALLYPLSIWINFRGQPLHSIALPWPGEAIRLPLTHGLHEYLNERDNFSFSPLILIRPKVGTTI